MRRQRRSPHISDFNGPLRDYNGTGRWSVVSVQERYLEYCRTLDVTAPELPCPKEQQEGGHRWIFPVMNSVIAGIRRGDKACVALGVEFIEEPEYFVYGRILKANTARALRGATLTSEQVVRLRARIVNMLLEGDVPHEYHEYSRLLRRIGWASGGRLLSSRSQGKTATLCGTTSISARVWSLPQRQSLKRITRDRSRLNSLTGCNPRPHWRTKASAPTRARFRSSPSPSDTWSVPAAGSTRGRGDTSDRTRGEIRCR